MQVITNRCKIAHLERMYKTFLSWRLQAVTKDICRCFGYATHKELPTINLLYKGTSYFKVFWKSHLYADFSRWNECLMMQFVWFLIRRSPCRRYFVYTELPVHGKPPTAKTTRSTRNSHAWTQDARKLVPPPFLITLRGTILVLVVRKTRTLV